MSWLMVCDPIGGMKSQKKKKKKKQMVGMV